MSDVSWTPEDRAVAQALEALGPTAPQEARLQRSVEARLARERTPLLVEWLELVRVRPLAHGGLVLAAACALLLTTPLGSLLWTALRSGTWQ